MGLDEFGYLVLAAVHRVNAHEVDQFYRQLVGTGLDVYRSTGYTSYSCLLFNIGGTVKERNERRRLHRIIVVSQVAWPGLVNEVGGIDVVLAYKLG
jgi:hypothetical protein